MAAGKNKALRWARLYFDGFDLSGDTRALGTLENNFDEADMTGVSESTRNFLVSGRNAGIRGYQAHLNDAAAGAHTALKNAGENATAHEVSMVLGGGVAPEIGDPAYLLAGVQLMDNSSFDSAAAILSADFLPGVGFSSVPWGVLLSPATSISSTTTGDSVDLVTAQTTAGWLAILHILAQASGNYAFKIQDSTNDNDWNDLLSFSINGSAVASEASVSISGTVDRYVRFVATRTGGDVTPVCTFARVV